MIILLIPFIWLAALAVFVTVMYRLGTRRDNEAEGWAHKRSPPLLDEGSESFEDEAGSFEDEVGRLLRATPAPTPPAAGSEPATAEHVRDGAQENLDVRPEGPVRYV